MVTLSEPEQLTATITDATTSICFGQLLSVSITNIKGGTPPYKVTYDGDVVVHTLDLGATSITFNIVPPTSGSLILNSSNVKVSDAHSCLS